VLDDALEQLQVLDRSSFGGAPVVSFPGLEVLGHAVEEQLGVCADPQLPCSLRVQLVDFADSGDSCGIFCSVVSAGPGEGIATSQFRWPGNTQAKPAVADVRPFPLELPSV
jgi:hypothetical protein